MIEAKYFRDYKHSYLILPCGSAQPEKDYTCRQLTSNKLEEILCCSLRHVNGASYFYYDISSRTTLENMYRGRQLSFGQVRELFEQLCGIYYRLGSYFMDERKLVLLPEFLFYDLSREKYIGLYYPDYVEDKPYEALMDYLLEHMDSRDERLANVIYQIYERTEESAFSLCDGLRLLAEQEEEFEAEKGETEKRSPYVPDDDSLSVTAFSLEETFPADVEKLRGEEKKETPVPGKKNVFSMFLIGLSVLGLAGTACVYGFYELSDEELITLFGCGALMGVCLLAGFVGLWKGRSRKKNVEETETILKEEAYLPVSERVSLEEVLIKEAERGLPMPVNRGTGERAVTSLSSMHSAGNGLFEEQGDCGNTVFFDSAETAEYKLYALDRRNKRHIELTKFPYTIGKMAGCVDCVLADESVSRIHARFEKEKGAICLTDMNSTNGTYKNGLRLQPQETVEVEPGDEIRFGNLNYCYR